MPNKHLNIPLHINKGQLYRYINSKETRGISKADLYYLKSFKPYMAEDGVECNTAYYKQMQEGGVEITTHENVIATYNGDLASEVKEYYDLLGFHGLDKNNNEMWCNSSNVIIIFGVNDDYNEIIYEKIYKEMLDEKLQERSRIESENQPEEISVDD